MSTTHITIFGAAGFIGTNLAIRLAADPSVELTVVDERREFFRPLERLGLLGEGGVRVLEAPFGMDTGFDELLRGQDIVFHLASSTVPATSGGHIPAEIEVNAVATARLLDACVAQGVRRVVFMSSGGAVYGGGQPPLAEGAPTEPLSVYGVQKLAIEKLLSVYRHLYGLDYRIVRMANPYGPYQRPGRLGVVTTFVWRALHDEPFVIYGDGSVVRDFIYIDDAITGILAVAKSDSGIPRLYNVGTGRGTSVTGVLETVQEVLGKQLDITYRDERKVDPYDNYLDITRYEAAFGTFETRPLAEGVALTAEFLRDVYPQLVG